MIVALQLATLRFSLGDKTLIAYVLRIARKDLLSLIMRSYFNLKENKTTVQTELLAGIATFLATAYIIVVNPRILSQTGMPFSGVLTATIIVCFFSSLLMGLYAKNPIVVAPGMGLNAFFTYTAVIGMGVPWQTALGAVFWSGILFLLLSVFNIRTYIVKAIPKPLRYAIAAGIGLFITLIGLVNGGFIIRNDATLVGHAPISANAAHLCRRSIAYRYIAGAQNKRRHPDRHHCYNAACCWYWKMVEWRNYRCQLQRCFCRT
jgi:xanthine/uracil/vitamin C permease (AzgA family)